jgi:hypothetical protein
MILNKMSNWIGNGNNNIWIVKNPVPNPHQTTQKKPKPTSA